MHSYNQQTKQANTNLLIYARRPPLVTAAAARPPLMTAAAAPRLMPPVRPCTMNLRIDKSFRRYWLVLLDYCYSVYIDLAILTVNII